VECGVVGRKGGIGGEEKGKKVGVAAEQSVGKCESWWDKRKNLGKPRGSQKESDGALWRFVVRRRGYERTFYEARNGDQARWGMVDNPRLMRRRAVKRATRGDFR
jgi:hypothetical protein